MLRIRVGAFIGAGANHSAVARGCTEQNQRFLIEIMRVYRVLPASAPKSLLRGQGRLTNCATMQ
jgi:hypothetical protein